MIASSRAILLAAALFTVAPLARGAQPAPSDAELETARALYRDAVTLHRQDKLDEALARITAAYRTVKTPVIALELAKIQVRLGHLADAWEVLRAADELPVSTRETERGRDARRELSALAASVRARLATIRAIVPADAEVRVDGERVESPDQGRLVEAGAHAVTVHSGGRLCMSTNLTLQEGELRAIDLRERAAATCARSDDPPPSPAPEREVEPAKPIAPATPDRPSGLGALDTKQWISIGLVGAGTLSAIVGGAVALRARSDYDAVAGDCPPAGCSASAYDVRESARGRAIAATYAIVLGVGAVAGGVTLWLLDDHDRAPSRRVGRVGLTVAPSAVWLTVPLR